ncbi:MAG TPA: PAS domain-containing protein [Terriglobales bacterium]|jgi:PAS domain S-box-containing protein|nr:PAS domain-containing protein [Terriglobales bacterium]
MESTTEIKRLQSCISDLISVLALPAIWSGSEASHILGTLLDVLLTMLRLDFVYARLPDASDGPAVEVVRLSDRRHFSGQPQQFGELLDRWLSDDQPGSRCAIPHPTEDGEVYIAQFSLGLQPDGGAFIAGSRRTDFPTEVERLLLRVAANQAGIGLQEARRSGEQKRISEMLEERVADRTKRLMAVNEELRRSEAYLAQAQKLSRTGSFGWKVSTGEIIWSEESFRIFQYDRDIKPTVELILQRVHPQDIPLVKETIGRASQDRKNFEHEYRLLMPDGFIKYVHVVARAVSDELDGVEFVGAVMDVTDRKRAEQALLSSDAYLAEGQKLSHTGSWACDIASQKMIHSSEEHRRLFGLAPAGDGAPSFEEFYHRIHPEDRDRTVDDLQKAIRAGTNVEANFRVVLPEGTTRYMYGIGHPLVKPSGDTGEFVGAVMDITERKRGETLRDGERGVLEMIARDAPLEEIFEKLARAVEARFDSSLCSVLLLDEDGQHVRHAAGPSLPSAYLKAIDGLRIGPKAGSCGTAMYRRESVSVTDILQDPLWEPYRDIAGSFGLRACWSTPMVAHSGKVLGSFAMYYREPRSPSPAEIRALEMATHLGGIAIERKHVRQELQRSESYLAEAQRLSHTGSWAFNTQQPVYWSEENFRIWGLDPQHGIPKREAILQRIHPEDRTRMLEYVQKTLDKKSDYAVEFRIVLPDGTVKHIQGLGHPVFSASGELVEVVGTQLDVTERKHAEEERERLRQAQAEIAHINRVTTMGELTASLAHEVNQPIAAAITDANTCLRWLNRDQPDMAEAREAAARVVKDATRAAEIISRTRLLFKKASPQSDLVDVNEIVREMVVLLRSEAMRYSITIRTELTDIPPVMGDRVQLQQVLMNLVANGIDAMKEVDGIRELAIKSEKAENDQLLISVSDTGVGLPPQQADQIFNPFFTTKPHGTGMGLRISRSIVESHGGRLWAARNSHRGASFYITLPSRLEACA